MNSMDSMDGGYGGDTIIGGYGGGILSEEQTAQSGFAAIAFICMIAGLLAVAALVLNNRAPQATRDDYDV